MSWKQIQLLGIYDVILWMQMMRSDKEVPAIAKVPSLQTSKLRPSHWEWIMGGTTICQTTKQSLDRLRQRATDSSLEG